MGEKGKKDEEEKKIGCVYRHLHFFFLSFFFWPSTEINIHYLSVLMLNFFPIHLLLIPNYYCEVPNMRKPFTGLQWNQNSVKFHTHSSSLGSLLCHYCLFLQLKHKVWPKRWNHKHNISIRLNLLKNLLLCSRLKCSLHSKSLEDDN